MPSRLEVGKGRSLWKWLTGPEGTAVYLGKPHPWRALVNFLTRHGVPADEVDGLATNIMMATPAGRAEFKRGHNKRRRHAAMSEPSPWLLAVTDG